MQESPPEEICIEVNDEFLFLSELLLYAQLMKNTVFYVTSLLTPA